MKIFQFLVIGVSAVIALSSAERDGGPGGSRHYESDDSGESEEAYKDYMRCISEMERCMDTLSKYHGFEAVQTLAQIKNAGAQTVCSTPPYTDCVTRIVNSSPNCKSGAVEFVDSIMNRFPFAVFGCPDHKKPAKSLKKF